MMNFPPSQGELKALIAEVNGAILPFAMRGIHLAVAIVVDGVLASTSTLPPAAMARVMRDVADQVEADVPGSLTYVTPVLPEGES